MVSTESADSFVSRTLPVVRTGMQETPGNGIYQRHLLLSKASYRTICSNSKLRLPSCIILQSTIYTHFAASLLGESLDMKKPIKTAPTMNETIANKLHQQQKHPNFLARFFSFFIRAWITEPAAAEATACLPDEPPMISYSKIDSTKMESTDLRHRVVRSRIAPRSYQVAVL